MHKWPANMRKKIIKIFKEIGFKIDIKTNLKIVNFSDMTFNLINVSLIKVHISLIKSLMTHYFILTKIQTIHHKNKRNRQSYIMV